jgi:AcrR family transcriptional regulator
MRGEERVWKGLSKGQQTREAIVAQGLLTAAREGLGAISIGRLAKELRMSKSGLFLHFGSKEKLELAVVEQALVQFLGHVLKRAEDDQLRGIERLWSHCDAWLDFVEHGPFPGGYFFTGVFFQTAKQNGPIPRLIRGAVRNWIDALEEAAKQARAREEIKTDTDTQEVAFELNSILLGAQWSHLMTGRDYTNARTTILSKFRSWAAEEIPEKAFRSVKAWKVYLANRDGRAGK